ncbi:MAG: hypothetical protein ABI923_03995 [bacterium]
MPIRVDRIRYLFAPNGEGRLLAFTELASIIQPAKERGRRNLGSSLEVDLFTRARSLLLLVTPTLKAFANSSPGLRFGNPGNGHSFLEDAKFGIQRIKLYRYR